MFMKLYSSKRFCICVMGISSFCCGNAQTQYYTPFQPITSYIAYCCGDHLSHIREALFRLFFKNSGVLIIYMDLNNQLNRIFNELLA
jgi:hypothetical protein